VSKLEIKAFFLDDSDPYSVTVTFCVSHSSKKFTLFIKSITGCKRSR